MLYGETPLIIGFTIFIVILLVLDLSVFHRKAHAVSVREASIWVGVWVSLALIFNVVVYFWRGSEAALQFLMGYLLEESLSVDNMFVFILLFSFFGVKSEDQPRVLFWGILGALVMRLTFILLGAALLNRFHWVIYVFGAFLVYTGIKMGTHRDAEVHPESNPVFRVARRFLPLSSGYHAHRFFTRENGRFVATPLFLVLLIVESTDVVFAVDSIPAIFGVTRDPFIIYTSNVFAILGLRSLYFLLAGVMDIFRYLKQGLAIILTFIGVKMLIAGFVEIPILVSLGIVFGILAISVAASVMIKPKAEEDAEPQGGGKS